jgi:hypothetical protein
MRGKLVFGTVVLLLVFVNHLHAQLVGIKLDENTLNADKSRTFRAVEKRQGLISTYSLISTYKWSYRVWNRGEPTDWQSLPDTSSSMNFHVQLVGDVEIRCEVEYAKSVKKRTAFLNSASEIFTFTPTNAALSVPVPVATNVVLNISCKNSTKAMNDISVYVNDDYVGKMDPHQPKKFAIPPQRGNATVYVTTTESMLGMTLLKIESDRVPIDMAGVKECDIVLQWYYNNLDCGPANASWKSKARFHVWSPKHDPGFTMKMQPDTDLASLWPDSPFGKTLRDDQVILEEGPQSEEYLNSWAGRWSLPSGSKLIERGLNAALDAFSAQKYMTLMRIGNSVSGYYLIKDGSGVDDSMYTYNVKFGKNCMLFNSYTLSIFGITDHKGKTLFIKDPKDDRRIFVYVKSDPTSSVYTYDHVKVLATQ